MTYEIKETNHISDSGYIIRWLCYDSRFTKDRSKAKATEQDKKSASLKDNEKDI